MTQKQRILAQLQAAGGRGVSPVDFLAPDVCDGGSPILRVAARILDLKNEGHSIDCQTEAGVAVYVLRASAPVVTHSPSNRKVVVNTAPVENSGGSASESPEEPFGLFDASVFEPETDWYEEAA
jgi:hypothetical protein